MYCRCSLPLPCVIYFFDRPCLNFLGNNIHPYFNKYFIANIAVCNVSQLNVPQILVLIWRTLKRFLWHLFFLAHVRDDFFIIPRIYRENKNYVITSSFRLNLFNFSIVLKSKRVSSRYGARSGEYDWEKADWSQTHTTVFIKDDFFFYTFFLLDLKPGLELYRI